MKTVLFAHDGYIIKQGSNYFSATYNNKIIEQYFHIASNIIFLVRVSKGFPENANNLNKINVNNFRVCGVENFKTPSGLLKIRTIYKQVLKEVSMADYIVARIPSDLGFMSVYAAIKLGKKFMVEVVGCPWDSLRHHSFLGKIVAPIYYILQKNMIRSCPFVIYVTESFLQERYKCFGKSISCSDVDLRDQDESIAKERIKKIEKNINTKKLVFGTIGPLNMKYKGFDTVIKAISRLNKMGFNHRYQIVGSGDTTWLSSIIRKYNAESFITIIPQMPHEHIFRWFDEIDVYVQPSKTEGLPRALIEAMSKGVPSIGSNVGGIPELLPKECIFKSGKHKDLLRIISTLTQDKLIIWSSNNYIKSLEYHPDLLKDRRLRFYRNFTK